MKKHEGKASDLGFGCLGNGTTVWDRSRERNGDFVQVAHISNDNVINWRNVLISDEQKKAIEDYANTNQSKK